MNDLPIWVIALIAVAIIAIIAIIIVVARNSSGRKEEQLMEDRARATEIRQEADRDRVGLQERELRAHETELEAERARLAAEQARIDAEHQEAVAAVKGRVDRLLAINGTETPTDFHRNLGKILWEYCGMARN